MRLTCLKITDSKNKQTYSDPLNLFCFLHLQFFSIPLTLSLLNTCFEYCVSFLMVLNEHQLHLNFPCMSVFQWYFTNLFSPHWICQPSGFSFEYGKKSCQLCATNRSTSNWLMLLSNRANLLHSPICYLIDFLNKELKIVKLVILPWSTPSRLEPTRTVSYIKTAAHGPQQTCSAPDNTHKRAYSFQGAALLVCLDTWTLERQRAEQQQCCIEIKHANTGPGAWVTLGAMLPLNNLPE